MLFRNSLLLLLSLIMSSPAAVQEKRLSINPTQKSGQRTTYKMQCDLNCRTMFADGSVSEEPERITAQLETLATEHQTDGRWTLRVTLTNFRGGTDKSEGYHGNVPEEGTLFITLDKNGRVLKVLSDQDEPPDENPFDGIFTGPFVVLASRMMLPTRPVAEAESWSIAATHRPGSGNDSDVQTFNGRGTLRALASGQAVIDVDFKSVLSSAHSDSEHTVTDRSTGSLTLTYELATALFVRIQAHTVWETIGYALSDNDNAVKTICDSNIDIARIKAP